MGFYMKITKKEQKANRKLWTKALRSVSELIKENAQFQKVKPPTE